MNEKDKTELQKAAKSLDESSKLKREQAEQSNLKSITEEKKAKNNFKNLQQEVILPFVDELETIFKTTSVSLSYMTNEHLKNVQAVIQNFIQINFHVKRGNKVYGNTPNIKFDLNPHQNKIRITKMIDITKGEILDEEYLADELGKSHIVDFLNIFVKECVAYYE
ncbi:MAG: hypothetical protein IIA45_06590 [Bacteroidetes bacterium]|nr:hypothetical protein [Bacteroidota bacterium]